MSREAILTNKTNPFVEGIDSFFKVSERGSTVTKEIYGGISVFLVSVCALFMQIQIIIEAYSDNIPYCGIYLASTLVAFIGTMLVGLICNLPLVQTASLSLSSVMIGMLTANAGLTYSNVLAITFVAAIVYAIISVMPVTKKLLNEIPLPIKKALPAALGGYICVVALDHMGIISDGGLASIAADNLGGASVAPYVRLCILVGILAVLLAFWNFARKADTPIFTALYVASIVFFLVAAVVGGIQFSYVFSQNRIWIGVNPDKLGEMYTISGAIKELSIGKAFVEGFDFSGYKAAGGNVLAIFVEGVLVFFTMGMLETNAATLGANECGEFLIDEKIDSKVFIVNAFTNIVAAVVGAPAMSVGKSSAVATSDGAKTGFSSVVCGIGYFIALFTWIPFVILSTYTASVPEYGHAGFVFPNVIQASFQIVDGIMLFIGIRMFGSIKKAKDLETFDLLICIFAIIFTIATRNLLYGVCAATVIYFVVSVTSKNKLSGSDRTISLYMNGVAALIIMIFALYHTGAATVTSINETETAATQNATTTDATTSADDNYADFTFDTATGDYSFNATEDVDYYTVWIYPVDADGEMGSEYVAASSRITDKGEISGNVDISSLSFGEYYATLNGFAESGNKDKIIVDFGVSGKLTTPEFSYTVDGNEVTVALYDDTLDIYNNSEMFTDIDVNIMDSEGNTVLTETLTDEDLVGQLMGPFVVYTCEKTIELEDGDYMISMKATGDGGRYAESSDESEVLSLSVKEGENSDGHTSNVVEEE